MRDDHLRPVFHVRPSQGFVNDPNGPVVVDGQLHLFHQLRPMDSGPTGVSWAHVSSPDMAHWRSHRPAIVAQPGGVDADGCWSGNTVVDEGGDVIAFYSAYVDGEPLQPVVHARSTDGGTSFGPAQRTLPDPDPDDRVRTFRDPFVWRVDGGWRMVVGSGVDGGTAVLRGYSSPDLRRWSYDGPLLSLPRRRVPLDTGTTEDTGTMWECPQIVTFDGVDVALVGTWTEEDGIMEVLTTVLGDEQPTFHRLDHGSDLYAASAVRDGPDGPVVWGWVTEGRSDDWCREDGWSGMLSLPRVVERDPSGRLRSRLPATIETLRGDEVAPASDGDALRWEHLGRHVWVTATMVRAADEERSSLRLDFTPGQHAEQAAGEHLDVVVEWTSGLVWIDRTAASHDPRADIDEVAFRDEGVATGRLVLDLLLDGSVVELFTSTGTVATTRAYPTSTGPLVVTVIGADGGHAWPMDAAVLPAAPDDERR